jgi:hypothetical protein
MGSDMQLELANDMLRYIAHRDQRLMRRVNRWPAPRWVRL